MVEDKPFKESGIDKVTYSEIRTRTYENEYSQIACDPQTGNEVAERLKADLAESHKTIDLDVNEGSSLTDIVDTLAAGLPDGEKYKRKFGSQAMKYTQIAEQLAAESEKPVVLIVRNLQNLAGPGGDDFIRATRALYNDRNFREPLKKYSVVFIADKEVNELLVDTSSTTYNIGKQFTV